MTRIHRRTLLAAGTALAAAAALPLSAFAQGAGTGEFFENRPLPEMELGAKDAPVIITEYASMTCPHCKSFHESVWPKLKEEYVDTGKVRYQLREFAFDNLAAAASMLARCAPNDGYFPMVDILFERQSQWSRAQNPAAELFNIAKLAGFTEETFRACLTNQKLLDDINAVRAEGRKFGVTGTPTIFVNGEKLDGSSYENIKKAIDAKLPS